MSPLAEIPYFDITKCFPQDCMHVLNEGVTELVCRLFLNYCIEEKGLFTIQQFNEQLMVFNFGHFNRDKPAIIQSNDLSDDKKLRQSAAQIFALAHILPFLIGKWIYNTEDEDVITRLDCFILLLQIMNLCLSYEIRDESVATLSRMIVTLKLKFLELYPGKDIPKIHFLEHIPLYIRLFGPARQQGCFRFESAHAYFKALVAIVRNFKNIPQTMCYRYQSRMCCRLFVDSGKSSKTFLYKGDHISPGLNVPLVYRPYVHLFDDLVRNECSVMMSPAITIHGINYSSKSIILLECHDKIMPVFGEINDICVLNNKIFFVVSRLETISYDRRVNAYQYQQSFNYEKQIIDVKKLIFPHPLSRFKIKSQTLIPLINLGRLEFIG